MKKGLGKRLLWGLLAVLLAAAALLFIRPQAALENASLSVEQVTVYGEDVTGELDENRLLELLREIKVSRMMDDAAVPEAAQGVSIAGSCDGEAFALFLGDYNVLSLGGNTYRVRNGSDLLIDIIALLPEGGS